MIKRDWSADQGGDIFVARADMIQDRSLRLAVVVADETSFGTEAELHEALIVDRDALHAQNLCLIERSPSRLPDDHSPSLDTVLRWSLAFY
ncbi:hypothetical protein ABID58_006986 [Bradyrhizobium sp. S3.2.6]|uniref:hypothetical protein n=1 Tax=Bradyrhizobium sp. S3.2.6 TaxID=3156428 RepID=UPI0033914C9F